MSGWLKAGQAGWSAIKGVLTKVNKTKLSKATSELNIDIQKTKGSQAKLKQTLFEIENPKFKGKDFTFSSSKKKTIKESDRKKQIMKDNSKVIGRMFRKALEDKK